MTRVEEHSYELPASELEKPAHGLFDLDMARLALEANRPQRKHSVAQVPKVLRPYLEPIKGRLDLRNPSPNTLRPPVRLPAERREAGEDLNTRIRGLDERLVGSRTPLLEEVACKLQVLLRHRSRSIPQVGMVRGKW